jgi:hypothetical protein
MVSPVDVANMALDTIGARYSITSLDPPAPAPNAITVARHYQNKIDALHRAAHWNFARKQAPLSLLKAAKGTQENPDGTALPLPPFPWQYEYAYPSDCLLARYLICNPQGANGGFAMPVFGAGVGVTPLWGLTPAGKFVVAVDTDASGNQVKVILTNIEFAECVYTARIVNPDLWDPQFLMAGSATLGAWLVNPTSGDGEMLKNLTAIVSGIVNQARVSDGNEGATSTDYVPDWMAVRGVTGLWAIDTTGAYYGWQAMTLPGGMVL